MHQPDLFPAPAPQPFPAPALPVTVAAVESEGPLLRGLFWRVTYAVGDQVVGYGIIGASTVAQARRNARQIAASIPASAIPEAFAAARAA